MAERLTSQKKIILDHLSGVRSHPTVDQIYNNIKDKLPRISRGTVYRILGNFKDKGSIQVIHTRESSHFDANISPHAHFICERCNSVYDVTGVCSECSILKNKKVKVGKINYFKIYFYGICKKCKK